MPFINGKRVRMTEYRQAMGFDPTLGYSDVVKRASGEDVEPEPEKAPEEAKPKRRRGTKKTEAQDALKAITGLDIDLGDEENEDNE